MTAESPSATGRLDPQRYFESIDADTERLLAMADRGLSAPVPCCPGWTVEDVVRHVGQVYEHKVRVMADNAWPTNWPPEEFESLDPVDFLVDAKAHLFAEFANHQLTDPTTTFSEDDTTVGFWARRMALEIAIHRRDGEAAHADVTPIPDDIAVDGVDEVLKVMLGGPWWETRVKTEHSVDGVVAVETGSRRWLCSVSATRADIGQDLMIPSAVTISGDPEPMFLWLWGRADDDQVTATGSREIAQEFRQRLVECTG